MGFHVLESHTAATMAGFEIVRAAVRHIFDCFGIKCTVAVSIGEAVKNECAVTRVEGRADCRQARNAGFILLPSSFSFWQSQKGIGRGTEAIARPAQVRNGDAAETPLKSAGFENHNLPRAKKA